MPISTSYAYACQDELLLANIKLTAPGVSSTYERRLHPSDGCTWYSSERWLSLAVTLLYSLGLRYKQGRRAKAKDSIYNSAHTAW